MIFIGYHQISELYFKLILFEIKQINESETLIPSFVTEKLTRCIRYMDNLIQSFDIMVSGLDRKQFAAFRLALFPASGFQSAQYRLIEILSTDFSNLLTDGSRDQLINDFEAGFEELYWVKASTKPNGEKFLAMRQFESRYKKELIRAAEQVEGKNIYRKLLSISKKEAGYSEMIETAKRFDYIKNQKWPNMHLKAARHHLSKPGESSEATGGTGWQKYLPPKFQRIIFFPLFWSEEELKNWGRLVD
jgi:tryptophan 2,3-dioxygenase